MSFASTAALWGDLKLGDAAHSFEDLRLPLTKEQVKAKKINTIVRERVTA